MNRAAIPLACRPELLPSPLPGGESGRYAAKNLRTGECYTLGGQEYFLLGRLDGGQTAADVCRAFQDRFGEGLSEEELNEFVELARARGFLEPVAATEPAPGTGCVTNPSPPTPGPLGGSKGGAGPAAPCRYDELPYAPAPEPDVAPAADVGISQDAEGRVSKIDYTLSLNYTKITVTSVTIDPASGADLTPDPGRGGDTGTPSDSESAAKVKFQDMHFTNRVGKHSPML